MSSVISSRSRSGSCEFQAPSQRWVKSSTQAASSAPRSVTSCCVMRTSCGRCAESDRCVPPRQGANAVETAALRARDAVYVATGARGHGPALSALDGLLARLLVRVGVVVEPDRAVVAHAVSSAPARVGDQLIRGGVLGQAARLHAE